MAIKRLSEKKLLNKKVGLIGTLTGEVVEVNINETKAGKEFLSGKLLVDGAKFPTQFTVFNTKSQEDLVDKVADFLRASEDSRISLLVVPVQEKYENSEGNTKTATKLRVLGLNELTDKQYNTLNVLANHIEDGTVYGEGDKGSYLVFKVGVTQTWFDKEKDQEVSKTDVFELMANGKEADRVAEEHADTPDGTLVQGRVRVDGQRLVIQNISVAPPLEEENKTEDIPF